MKVEELVELIGSDFYVGVPDSQLKALGNYLMNTYGIDRKHHVIAANEGNCAAIAAGYYLATGRIPVVYMQNSGEGNAINPIASLLSDKVYAIPVVFIVGWRGEPGIQDEPQHIHQGEVTLQLLEDMGIRTFVIGQDTVREKMDLVMCEFKTLLSKGKSVAFVVRKGALSYEGKTVYKNHYAMKREEAIRHIMEISGTDVIVSTTGKISRELFEIRDRKGQNHKYDFLTVGSMGHSSSIALGIAISKPDVRLWCVDGDGSVLMHMGSMAVIGSIAPENMIHVVINNEAHESVGGMPTVAGTTDLAAVARACGYPYAVSVSTLGELDRELRMAKGRRTLSFIEIRCSIGSRENLGRPTTAAMENKKNFMEYLENL